MGAACYKYSIMGAKYLILIFKAPTFGLQIFLVEAPIFEGLGLYLEVRGL